MLRGDLPPQDDQWRWQPNPDLLRHVDEMVPALGADIWHFGSDAHLVPDLLDRVGERVVLFGGLIVATTARPARR